MAEYYAVERSSEYLKHYGIKGMRWGVRKAREMGGERGARKLAKQYKKALNKIQKLNRRANIDDQKQEAKDRLELAGLSLGTGAAIAGGSLGLRALNRSTNTRTIAAGRIGLLPFMYDSETAPKVAVPIGAGFGALGAYELGKGIAAKRRSSAKGHVKAVNKANIFRKEMKKAFNGTKYASLPGSKKKSQYY